MSSHLFARNATSVHDPFFKTRLHRCSSTGGPLADSLGAECVIDTSAAFCWVDIKGYGAMITDSNWAEASSSNNDDGWYNIPLSAGPAAFGGCFMWFGTCETVLTVPGPTACQQQLGSLNTGLCLS